MKKIAAIILVIALVICTVGAGVSGGTDRVRIRKLISTFQDSVQDIGLDGNVKRLINCLDPYVIDGFSWLVELVKINPDYLVEFVNAVLGVGTTVTRGTLSDSEIGILVECLSTLKFKPLEYKFNDSKTRCTVYYTYTIKYYGEKYHDTGELECVKRDRKWYIAVRL